ncbi:MAG: hypothetical protein V4858_19600 [Pseudomonadota bacterium]
MHTSLHTLCQLTLIAATMLLATGGALAAGTSRDLADAQERYRQEMAVCNSGQSNQDVKTCRIEARNALAEAKRGGLTAAPGQYDRNATQRCEQFKGDERTACEARILNPSRVDGSVAGGGVLRESVIVVPAQ